MDAGKMREHIEIYTPKETGGGVVREKVYEVWAQMEKQKGRSVFASFGLAAELWKCTLRRRGTRVEESIDWNGGSYYITAVRRQNSAEWEELDLARVAFSQCECGGAMFYGVLTEKYAANRAEDAYNSDQRTRILVTPKQTEIEEGSTILVDGEGYYVALAHDFDPTRNEYELMRQRDV